MLRLWTGLGFIRFPLTFSLFVVVALTLWSAWKVFGPDARPDGRTKAWVDAVLFWGAFSAVSGVLGTLLGVIVAAQSIEMAGEVSTTLLWGGIKVALLSSALGTLVFCGAALAWFVLQLRWRMLEERAA